MSKGKTSASTIFEQITKEKMIPILVEYEPFNKLILHGTNTAMEKLIAELKEIIKEEKAHILEIKNLSKEKSRATAKVLYFSEQVNKEDGGKLSDLNKLENERLSINNANSEIEQRQDKINNLLTKKEEVNLSLLKETITYCYKNIEADEKNLKVVLKKIDEIRKELEENRIKRDDLQDRVNNTYSFIHGLMGSKATEKIDSSLLG